MLKYILSGVVGGVLSLGVAYAFFCPKVCTKKCCPAPAACCKKCECPCGKCDKCCCSAENKCGEDCTCVNDCCKKCAK